MHCLEGHAWSVACHTQLTGHDGGYRIDRVQYLVSSVEPSKNVIHLTPLQFGDVVLSYSITGTTAPVSIRSDCEVHTELVGTSVVLGYSLNVVFKLIGQTAESIAKWLHNIWLLQLWLEIWTYVQGMSSLQTQHISWTQLLYIHVASIYKYI